MITLLLIVLSIVFIVVSTIKWSLHPFLSLILTCFLFGFLYGLPLMEIVDVVNTGFGDTVGKIGIIIIAGVIIGAFLEESGGAFALANKILKLTGRKRVHEAMAIIGYIVSIPVFADSGFVILNSLNRAVSKEANVSLAGTAIALALGLMATHTMVPPTPGPITAAGILDADLGLVILLGLFVSTGSLIVAIIFSKKIAGKVWIDPEPDLSQEEVEIKIKNAPSSFKSFMPILIPLLLIVLGSIADYPTKPFGEGQVATIISFVGSPVVALLLGIFVSFSLPKKLTKEMISSEGWVGKALKSGATIILITGAGGAFGKILQTSNIGELLGAFATDYKIGLWLPFLIAAGIKSAQGSSTIALTTTAAIIAPMLMSLGMVEPLEKAMVVIAIGAGSAVVSHANDSFFWVVTQMTGMNVGQGYKLHTLGSGILGFTAILILTVISLLF